MNSGSAAIDLEETVRSFIPGIQLRQAAPFGSGHINDTFLISLSGTEEKYILQRINKAVFRDVPGLMHNIGLVCEHILSKLEAGKSTAFRKECYTFLKTEKGQNYFEDAHHDFWRMTPFVENSQSFDTIDSGKKAYNGGAAYGEFLLLLHDLPPELLTETIPDFHNVEYRLDNLEKAVQEDPLGRAGEVGQDIRFLRERKTEMVQILQAGKRGELPLRITHNDTKFNNILFDDEEQVIGVVDLDTVMPGYVHYDFGDAIRTGASTAAEDEKNTDRMELDLGLFEAFTAGYLSKTYAFLTKEEIDFLPLSAKLLTYIMAVRFLTDYICGDIYYRISHARHNLQRARTQIKLIQDMELHYSDMITCVERLASL